MRQAIVAFGTTFGIFATYLHVSEWRGLAGYGRTDDFAIALPGRVRPSAQVVLGQSTAATVRSDVATSEEEVVSGQSTAATVRSDVATSEEEVEEIIEYIDEDPIAEATSTAPGQSTQIPATPTSDSGVAEDEEEGYGDVEATNDVEEIRQESIVSNTNSETPLCIALAADLDQLENVVVAINSTLQHSSKKRLLQFRIITMEADKKLLMEKLRSRFADSANIEAVVFDPLVKRVSQLVGGSSSGRQELFNELNFAAFYVHELLPTMTRVLYLDTDVVVLGDVQAELSEWNMGSFPVAGAKDCSQKVGKYVHFKKLKALKGDQKWLSKMRATRADCVVNRGVVLIDTVAWAAENVTGLIEELVRVHLSDEGPLWHSGVSQPPFLLAIAGRYMNMGYQYNVRGLGRNDMSVDEVRHFKRSTWWTPYMNKFLFINRFGRRKIWTFAPTIVGAAHRAKVLHFNGRLKPIMRDRCSHDPVVPPPKTWSNKEWADFESRPLCSCGDSCMMECAAIWWRYTSATLVQPVAVAEPAEA